MEPELIKRKPPPGIDECWALDHYATQGGRTELADLFTDAKYRHPAVGAQLGARLADTVRRCAPESSLLKCAEMVVVLPSSRGLARRLSTALATELELDPPDAHDLSWIRHVESMKHVPPLERAGRVRGAMRAKPIDGGTVLLVDDVMQSMATFVEAARAVRAAGAERVVCIALVLIDV